MEEQDEKGLPKTDIGEGPRPFKDHGDSVQHQPNPGVRAARLITVR
jgi:hypothetical protein